MRSPLRAYVEYREERLAAEEDPLKAVHPLEWGLDCLGLEASTGRPLDALLRFVTRSEVESGTYYQPGPLRDWTLEGTQLTFPSSLTTGCPENDLVRARVFETAARERAVVLMPYWNAVGSSLDLVCRLLQKAGIACLRLSLPYHDERRPPSMAFARDMVSANIGMTLRSNRQAVLDIRSGLDWLEARGYRRLGLLGMSLGSSVGTVAAAHDPRVAAAVFCCSAALFGEAVWTGRATRHIRNALETAITLDQINALWSLISPGTFVPRLEGRPVRHLIISGVHDNVFLPHLTAALVERYQRHDVSCSWVRLPCGHYTLGTFPFNAVLLTRAIRFLQQSL